MSRGIIRLARTKVPMVEAEKHLSFHPGTSLQSQCPLCSQGRALSLAATFPATAGSRCYHFHLQMQRLRLGVVK